MNLAHVVGSQLGEMTASIAHEINQPLGAIVNSASAGLRWLEAQKLEEARRSVSRVIAEGHRAGEIIARIRALAKKAPPEKDWLDINQTIREVIVLARSKVQRNGVALDTRLSDRCALCAAHFGRSNPIATGDSQSDDERHRSHEWSWRGSTRVVNSLRHC